MFFFTPNFCPRVCSMHQGSMGLQVRRWCCWCTWCTRPFGISFIASATTARWLCPWGYLSFQWQCRSWSACHTTQAAQWTEASCNGDGGEGLCVCFPIFDSIWTPLRRTTTFWSTTSPRWLASLGQLFNVCVNSGLWDNLYLPRTIPDNNGELSSVCVSFAENLLNVQPIHSSCQPLWGAAGCKDRPTVAAANSNSRTCSGEGASWGGVGWLDMIHSWRSFWVICPKFKIMHWFEFVIFHQCKHHDGFMSSTFSFLTKSVHSHRSHHKMGPTNQW